MFPFKASPYLIDELIDWEAKDLRKDPMYVLVMPTLEMLSPANREKLIEAKKGGDPMALIDTVADIREELNPHPAGQKTLNAPKEEKLTGVQHKYSETALVFPAAAQTCHAYCTYCFRWAQFIGDDELRFAQKEAAGFFEYVGNHPTTPPPQRPPAPQFNRPAALPPPPPTTPSSRCGSSWCMTRPAARARATSTWTSTRARASMATQRSSTCSSATDRRPP